jgi:hypothetical protein
MQFGKSFGRLHVALHMGANLEYRHGLITVAERANDGSMVLDGLLAGFHLGYRNSGHTLVKVSGLRYDVPNAIQSCTVDQSAMEIFVGGHGRINIMFAQRVALPAYDSVEFLQYFRQIWKFHHS